MVRLVLTVLLLMPFLSDAGASVTNLHALYGSVESELATSPFKRPLLMRSKQLSDGLIGEIYAVVEHPMAVVRAQLGVTEHWCDLLLLHSNIKYCRTNLEGRLPQLAVYVGSKEPQDLARASRADFGFYVEPADTPSLEVKLTAPTGPMGTSNYLIRLRAVPLSGTKTFLHFTYSYNMNALGRMAMGAYLMTGGLGKVGFTVSGDPLANPPQHIDGMLALLERNTMRYFLAIDSFLQFANEPSDIRFDKRLHAWYAAVEQYPRQLHEMDLPAYLAMKRAEYARQQTAR